MFCVVKLATLSAKNSGDSVENMDAVCSGDRQRSVVLDMRQIKTK
jgi:hypothetical protein